jgi:peptidylprolyl isomerase
MKRLTAALLMVVACSSAGRAQQKSPGAGPILVLETVKGTIEIETYPEEAPKTVARIVELTKKNFYTGQRFVRSEPGFLVQLGDPVSRDVSREAWWGRQGSGKAIGVAEITKKRKNVAGAVAMSHPGNVPTTADSQLFVLRRAAPELDGHYTVFGHVLKGMDVVAKIQRGDVVKRAYLKDE